jgi:hypothetical protein
MELVVKIRAKERLLLTDWGNSLELPIGGKVFNDGAFNPKRGEGVLSEEHTLLVESDLLPRAPGERTDDDDLQRLQKRLTHYFESYWPRITVDLEFLRPEEGAKALAEIAKRRSAVTENGRAVREVFSDGWRN